MEHIKEEGGPVAGDATLLRAQAAQNARDLQLAALNDYSPVALCLVDSQRRFVVANAAFADILEIGIKVVEGLDVGTLMPELGRILDVYLNNTAKEQAVPEFTQKGRSFQVAVRQLGEEGSRSRFLSVALTDVTHQKSIEKELAEANQRLLRYAHEDYLTGLYNRRHIDKILRTELARANREGGSTSLLMFDLDYFKQYNDRYGHQAGDDCLRLVAKQMTTVINRQNDCLGRYGGEEFTAILPNTSEEGALTVALRVQAAMKDLPLPAHLMPEGGVTFSVGVATLRIAGSGKRQDTESLAHRLLASADQALYDAKKSGRDQVVQRPLLIAGED